MKRMDKIVISIVFIAMIAFSMVGCDGFRGYYDTDYEDAYNDSIEANIDDNEEYNKGYGDGWHDARKCAVDFLKDCGYEELAEMVESAL